MSQEASNPTPTAPVEEAPVAENTESTQETTQETAPEGSSEGQISNGEQKTLNNLEAKQAAGKKLTKEEKKSLKKLKLKVDGQEFEEELPFEIPDTPEAVEYARRHLQMSKLGQKRAQEKATIEKEVMEFIADLRKDPRKVLQDPRLGIDIKKLAEQVIEQEIENAKKSPEQLKAEQLEAQLKELMEQREKEKEESKQKEFERLKQQEFERFDILMSQAFDKAELPKSPYYVKKMADYMLLGLENGMDVTPEDVLPMVQEEAFEDFRQLLAVLPVDKAEKLIGKDIINTIRKKNISKAKQANSNPAVKAPTKIQDTGKKTQETKTNEKINFKKFFGI